MLDLKLNPPDEPGAAVRIDRWKGSTADIALHLTITTEANRSIKAALWLVSGSHPVLSCRSLGLPVVNRSVNLTCELPNVAVTGDRFGPVWLVLEAFHKPFGEDPRIWRLVVTQGTHTNVVRFDVEDRRDRLAHVLRALNNVPRAA